MSKIKIYSIGLKWACMLPIVFVLVSMVFFWFFNMHHSQSYGATHTSYRFDFIPDGITISQAPSILVKVAGFFISLAQNSMLFLVFIYLIKLFSLYGRREVFSLRSVKLIRKVGVVLLLSELVFNPIGQMLLSLLLTFNNSPGDRALSVSLSGSNMSLVLVAVIVLLLSFVMKEAQVLQAEVDQTV